MASMKDLFQLYLHFLLSEKMINDKWSLNIWFEVFNPLEISESLIYQNSYSDQFLKITYAFFLHLIRNILCCVVTMCNLILIHFNISVPPYCSLEKYKWPKKFTNLITQLLKLPSWTFKNGRDFARAWFIEVYPLPVFYWFLDYYCWHWVSADHVVKTWV